MIEIIAFYALVGAYVLSLIFLAGVVLLVLVRAWMWVAHKLGVIGRA